MAPCSGPPAQQVRAAKQATLPPPLPLLPNGDTLVGVGVEAVTQILVVVWVEERALRHDDEDEGGVHQPAGAVPGSSD